ncbi:MAG: hypothetical protein GYA33_16355 [Thermogutta sp.]|nr:hypothetical protein [Thermogutta sp.]
MIGLVVVLVILLCAGVILGVGVFGMRALPPYQTALEKVQNDPRVRERLGEPIESASWIPTGSFKVENDSGSANLTFKVSGPRGKAEVNVIARMIAGKWGLTTLAVTYPDGTRQELDVSDTGDDEMDAPKWTPRAEPAAFPPGERADSAGPSAAGEKDEENAVPDEDNAAPGPQINLEIPPLPGAGS